MKELYGYRINVNISNFTNIKVKGWTAEVRRRNGRSEVKGRIGILIPSLRNADPLFATCHSRGWKIAEVTNDKLKGEIRQEEVTGV